MTEVQQSAPTVLSRDAVANLIPLGFGPNDPYQDVYEAADAVMALARPENEVKAEALEERRWWVATEFLDRGGKKVLGPFASRDEAMTNRTELEQRLDDYSFFVDEEGSAEALRSGGES